MLKHGKPPHGLAPFVSFVSRGKHCCETTQTLTMVSSAGASNQPANGPVLEFGSARTHRGQVVIRGTHRHAAIRDAALSMEKSQTTARCSLRSWQFDIGFDF